MAKVVWTAEAEQWLRRIHDYIAADKPAAAFGVVQSLYKRARSSLSFPTSAMLIRPPRSRSADTALGHYRIVYLRRSEGEVHILGVFHGAMDLKQYVP